MSHLARDTQQPCHQTEDHRQTDYDQLAAYQHHHLDHLQEQLAAVDAQIAQLELSAVHHANLISAARGLVYMRGGEPTQLTHHQPQTSRARPKQRLWVKANGRLQHHPTDHHIQTPPLTLTPIGLVYTPFRKRFEAPRQSFTGVTARATILLLRQSPFRSEHAIALLRTFVPGARVWLLYWFDRNSGLWRNFVRPPRAKGGWRVGVFATRSPNRPSPIGLTLARIESIDLRTASFVVSGVDILDETPLLAFRLYDSDKESHPSAACGWLDNHDAIQPLYYDPVQHTGVPHLVITQRASTKLDFVNGRSAVDIRFMVQESLKRLVSTHHQHASVNPKPFTPHHTSSLPVGAFRVIYEMPNSNTVHVSDVLSGMRSDVCEAEALSDPEAKLHLDFQRAFCQQNHPASP